MDIATVSAGITPSGTFKVEVPKNDLAYLMYYLCCVTKDVDLYTLDDDIVDYKHYWRLSDERRALVLLYAVQFSPKELIDKVIFRDDLNVFTKEFRNEFCNVSVACNVVSIRSDVLIAGKIQTLTKVMFYKQSWLDEYYTRPLQRAVAKTPFDNAYFRGITLYLAPLLYLTALFLSIFVYLSPSLIFHDKIALLTITPSTASGPLNGPRFFLGALGSCSNGNNATQVQCTNPKLPPLYNLTILPSSAPEILLPSNVSYTPFVIAIALGSALAFFILYILISFRYYMGRMGQRFDSRRIQKFTVFLGVMGFFTGLGSFVVLRMSLGTTVQRFNNAIQDPKGPQFVARTGNGFTMLWIAYGFYAFAGYAALYKLGLERQGSFWRT